MHSNLRFQSQRLLFAIKTDKFTEVVNFKPGALLIEISDIDTERIKLGKVVTTNLLS